VGSKNLGIGHIARWIVGVIHHAKLDNVLAWEGLAGAKERCPTIPTEIRVNCLARISDLRDDLWGTYICGIISLYVLKLRQGKLRREEPTFLKLEVKIINNNVAAVARAANLSTVKAVA